MSIGLHMLSKRAEVMAFCQAIAKSTIGIVGCDARGVAGRQLGTGSLVLWNGERHVLTADHVVCTCALGELMFFPPTPGTMPDPVESAPVLIPSDQLRHRVRLPLVDVSRDPTLDVSLLKFDPGANLPEDWHFRPLEKRVFKHRYSDGSSRRFMILGYPTAVVRQVGDDDYMAFARFEETSAIDPDDDLILDYDRDVDLVLSLPPTNGVHPSGYSGCGVWAALYAPDDSAVWTVEPILVGVEKEYLPKKGALRCIHVNAIVRRFM